jgi:hypothetical protein
VQFSVGIALLTAWTAHAWSSSHHTVAARLPCEPLWTLLSVLLPAAATHQTVPGHFGTACQLVSLAVLEGSLGCTAVALLGGRWMAWLTLWLTWLAVLCLAGDKGTVQAKWRGWLGQSRSSSMHATSAVLQICLPLLASSVALWRI